MIYQIISILCLVLLALEAVYVLKNVVLSPHSESVSFLRSFKNGKCAIIYFIAIPLYTAGHVYAGKSFFAAFFTAISKIINLVVLKYDVSTVEALMEAEPLYNVAVYTCFFLVGLNALMFSLSLVAQHAWVAWHSFITFLSRRGTLYLFGNNPENVSIYMSEKHRRRLIVDVLDKEAAARLYSDEVVYENVSSRERKLLSIVKSVRCFNKEHIVVINMGSDEENIRLCRYLVEEMNKAEEAERGKFFAELKVYVFGDPKYEGIYLDIVSSGYGCINFVNKYQKMAFDFIDRYPFAAFMNDTQIDFQTSMVKAGVDINVILLGFGKANQQIFLSSVANNQFITADKKGEVKIKQVEYYIFDKDETENNKNLNHTYYRFENEFSDVTPEDYLEMPDQPAHEKFRHLDINSPSFYCSIRDIVLEKPNDANFVVIAFGSDLENIDMAQKLVEKRREWQLDDLVIFVKARAWHKEQTLLEQDNCFFIGNEEDCVYNIDRIVGDSLHKMAHLRNSIHRLECEITEHPDLVVDEEYLRRNDELAERAWYIGIDQYQRESSLYACLSLRSKLMMMGLDYCPKGTGGVTALTEEEYLEIYAGDDKPIPSAYPKANGKTIVSYPLEHKRSRRYNLAFHDHLRWNAYMITKGFVPSTLEQIRNECIVDGEGNTRYTDGKSYELRRHGNITTFDGLVTFRKIVAERDGVDEAKKDKIKHDFNLLDDAYWIITKCGYVIYKRSERGE